MPSYLQYHNLRHTLDVCSQAEKLALQEGVTATDLKHLLLAAAYHDCGFLQQVQNHEAISCTMAIIMLPTYGYSDADLQTICSIIMATKLPQKPQNLLQQIICDADLDYLGREDFFECGQHLYNEWLNLGLVQNEKDWNKQQVDFLENHHYFTATAIAQRSTRKAINLGIIQHKLIEL